MCIDKHLLLTLDSEQDKYKAEFYRCLSDL